MKFVYFFAFLVTQTIIVWCTDENDVIRDYFSHKNVDRIVGFSCGNMKSEINLARAFNELYITYISIWDLDSANKSSVDLKQILNADYHRLGISLDLRCDSRRYNRIFTVATQNLMYDAMHKWLIMGHNLSHSLQILNDDAFSVTTDLVIAVPTLNNYTFYDVYNPCKDRGGSMNVTVFGTWSSKEGLNITLNQSKFTRRSNLHGMRLKVGVAKQSNREKFDREWVNSAAYENDL